MGAQIIAFPRTAAPAAPNPRIPSPETIRTLERVAQDALAARRETALQEVGRSIRENAKRRGRLIQVGAMAKALSLAQHIEELADLAGNCPAAAEVRANALRLLGRMEAAHG